jgi:ribosome biogenesis GTPase
MSDARVITFAHEIYTVETNDGSVITAELSGRLRYSGDVWPAVGDYVALRGGVVIDQVVSRRNSISRKQPGSRTEEQVLAANVDVVFIVTGLDCDFNLRRLERYVVLARESSARPIIVLNKADLITDREAIISSFAPAARETPIEFVTALAGDVSPLTAHVRPGETAVLLGSSGVGKSTIVNALLGRPLQKTSAVREHDSRGRHTTSQRQLLKAPGEWFLIDTPGLREIQLWADTDSVDAAFDEISAAAANCQFGDCTHTVEPGCAVQQALEAGALNESRVGSYHKLRREAAFLERKQDERARSDYNRNIRQMMRALRSHPKYKR